MSLERSQRLRWGKCQIIYLFLIICPIFVPRPTSIAFNLKNAIAFRTSSPLWRAETFDIKSEIQDKR